MKQRKIFILLFCLYSSMNVYQIAAENQSLTAEKMVNCCNIGAHLSNCSDDGINQSVMNAPIGLCLSAMKLCCGLRQTNANCEEKFHKKFDENCKNANESFTSCCEGCKVGKFIAAVDLSCHQIPQMLGISSQMKSLITNCCTNAQPQEIRRPPQQYKHRACKLGYKWNKKNSECQDINECEIINNGCYETQKCVNTQGSYYCIPKDICRDGFEYDENFSVCKKCDNNGKPLVEVKFDDLNGRKSILGDFVTKLPATDLTASSSNQIDRILCPKGLALNPQSNKCEDIDECANNLCSHNCQNTVGSFRCSCNRGYRLFNATKCVDINECKNRVNACSHYCLNVKGSFRCKCPNGMKIGIDKRTCVDINECVERRGICGNRPCINLNGSYTCNGDLKCPDHYKIQFVDEKNKFRKCVRQPCNTAECKLLPKYFNYKNLTLSSKRLDKEIPIYNIKTRSLRFDVIFKHQVAVESKETQVKAAAVNDFSIKKQSSRALVMLLNKLEGPQTVILNIDLLRHGKKIMETYEIKIFIMN